MSIMGSFGQMVFEVSDNKILTPNGVKRDISSRWANHEIIAKKPISEFIGPGLDKVSFSMALCQSHGISPKTVMDQLLTYCRSGDVFPLILGVPIGVDKWKIVSVSQIWDVVSAKGEIVSGKVDVEFEEYITQAWG